MRRLELPIVAAVTASAILGLAAAAGARVRSCPLHTGLFNFRNGQEYVSDLSVRNMSCHQAVHALHNAHLIGWPPNPRAGRFRCHIIQGGYAGATIRCVHHHPYRVFRVSIST